MTTLLPDVLLVAAPGPLRTQLAAALRARWPTRPLRCAETLTQVAELTHEQSFHLLIVVGIGRELDTEPILAGLGRYRPTQPVVVLRTVRWGAARALPASPPHLLVPRSNRAAWVTRALSPWLEPQAILPPPGARSSQTGTVLLNFTPRELEILQRIAADQSSEEIAEALYISPRTVEFHRRALRQKAGTRTVSGLVAQAIRAGWVS